MVAELHQRGYTSLYLYSGMSPSGMNWRFSIGKIQDGRWPTYPEITSGSLRTEGEVDWTADNLTVASLADGFEAYFSEVLPERKPAGSDYSLWYRNLLAKLNQNELLVFYADYFAPHEELLENAPGYIQQ